MPKASTGSVIIFHKQISGGGGGDKDMMNVFVKNGLKPTSKFSCGG